MGRLRPSQFCRHDCSVKKRFSLPPQPLYGKTSQARLTLLNDHRCKVLLLFPMQLPRSTGKKQAKIVKKRIFVNITCKRKEHNKQYSLMLFSENLTINFIQTLQFS